MTSSEKQIFTNIKKKGFKAKHVAEVGVWHPETSNIYDYIKMGVRCTLVEPDPKSIKLIRAHFSKQENITLHPVAVYDFNGKIELSQRAASTFVSALAASPALVNDQYQVNPADSFEVEAKTFDKIDEGDIDLLSVDIEGSEWFVIKHMRSRPTVISIETHGAIYLNPHLSEILAWMKKNGYAVWYKDNSDTVFIKPEQIEIDWKDKIKLTVTELHLSIRRTRKKLKQHLKNCCSKQLSKK
ncbi:hypothetical protein MNBD_NITROSPIRAE01-674 [hydrothermal vent metagenome]|uniref:Methyltransferase FkbM domain-containing protein n=1 Tax=hydrothermal vent metagenome TaxID=652676 RepID=A0A3B1D619_9ZZZZ